MATRTDYIPAKDADALNWLQNFAAVITANLATYGISAPDSAAINTAVGAFATSYALVTDPGTRTSAAIAQKDADRAAAEFLARPFAVTISRSPSITPEDKVLVGVTVSSGTRTPTVTPATAPGLTHVSSSPGVTTLAFRDAAIGSTKKKPDGVGSMQVFAIFGVSPAVDPNQAKFVSQTTKTPFTVPTPVGDAGKVLTVFARWVTIGGVGGQQLVGPWSAAFSITAM